ncbi:MAG: hypothetical protein RL596_1907 [Bacteroidota bacterium]
MPISSTSLLRLAAATLLLLIAFSAFAQEKAAMNWPVKLDKSFSKSAPISSQQVVLNNKFGAMQIETWDKKEVKIEAVINVASRDNETAQEMLDRISIDELSSNEKIGFRTLWKENQQNWNNGKSYEIKVNYKVWLPNGTKLIAENSFGPLTIGDYAGQAELISKYGNLTAGKLSKGVMVRIEFGKSDIVSLSDGELVLKYSKTNINSLSGDINAVFEFSSGLDLPLSNSLKKFTVKANYSSLYFLTETGFNADYDLVFNNGSASGKGSIKLTETTEQRSIGYSPTKKYKGSIGKGGDTQITLKSNFGSLRILGGS